jgi:hypothetical protein
MSLGHYCNNVSFEYLLNLFGQARLDIRLRQVLFKLSSRRSRFINNYICFIGPFTFRNIINKAQRHAIITQVLELLRA